MSEPARTIDVEHGAAGRPLPGHRRSGDRAVVAPYPGGTLVAVIDGLGHGPLAADAADVAAEALLAAVGKGTGDLMRQCHQALRRTRGAAVGIATVASTPDLEWLSVGNVSGALVSRATRRVTRLPSRGGIVGLRLPRLQPATAVFDLGDLLVLFTDGVAETVIADVRPVPDLPALAASLLDRYALKTDDALVLVGTCGRRH